MCIIHNFNFYQFKNFSQNLIFLSQIFLLRLELFYVSSVALFFQTGNSLVKELSLSMFAKYLAE